MTTAYGYLRDLRRLHVDDAIDVCQGYSGEWRPAIVTDRQSDGAPDHMPFHIDVEFHDDAGGPYEVITICEKQQSGKTGRFVTMGDSSNSPVRLRRKVR